MRKPHLALYGPPPTTTPIDADTCRHTPCPAAAPPRASAGAYILGTLTLLVVKADERTGRYRDLSASLRVYSAMNNLPQDLKETMQVGGQHLRTSGVLGVAALREARQRTARARRGATSRSHEQRLQGGPPAHGKLPPKPHSHTPFATRPPQEHLRLAFSSSDASDDAVLSMYPSTLRRRILRHLYLPLLRQSYLFRGTPKKFLVGARAPWQGLGVGACDSGFDVLPTPAAGAHPGPPLHPVLCRRAPALPCRTRSSAAAASSCSSRGWTS